MPTKLESAWFTKLALNCGLLACLGLKLSKLRAKQLMQQMQLFALLPKAKERASGEVKVKVKVTRKENPKRRFEMAALNGSVGFVKTQAP